MRMCSDDVSTSKHEGCRVVGYKASGRMTTRRVYGWPTQLGKNDFSAKWVATEICNKSNSSLWSTSGDALGLGRDENVDNTATKFGAENLTSSRDRLAWLDATRNGLQQGTLHLRKRAQFGAITR